MPKKANSIICSKEELKILNNIQHDKKLKKRLGERAKIILFCHKGLRNDQISKKLHITPLTVAKWRKRFNKYRLDGLKDKIRPGKPKKYDESIRKNILNLIEKPHPSGQSRWDGKTIAEQLGISPDIVWRILRKEGINLKKNS